MAEAAEPPAVKLICGMIAANTKLFDEALGPLTDAFGPADLISDTMDFDLTDYYNGEMGSPLYRRFVAFADLVNPEFLAAAKLAANNIERRFAAARSPKAPPRPINLDPGYVTPAKLVLASMKNFSHRIYLGRGVYAEITLIYRKDGWHSLQWTFPDYASGRYDTFLTAVRDRLRQQPLQERHR